jgi:hypothetical protein
MALSETFSIPITDSWHFISLSFTYNYTRLMKGATCKLDADAAGPILLQNNNNNALEAPITPVTRNTDDFNDQEYTVRARRPIIQ